MASSRRVKKMPFILLIYFAACCENRTGPSPSYTGCTPATVPPAVILSTDLRDLSCFHKIATVTQQLQQLLR